jgi:hypothetical protein
MAALTVRYFDRDADVWVELAVHTDCLRVEVPAGDEGDRPVPAFVVHVNTDAVRVDARLPAGEVVVGGLEYADLLYEYEAEQALERGAQGGNDAGDAAPRSVDDLA